MVIPGQSIPCRWSSSVKTGTCEVDCWRSKECVQEEETRGYGVGNQGRAWAYRSLQRLTFPLRKMGSLGSVLSRKTASSI
jgi:hypothetical protein